MRTLRDWNVGDNVFNNAHHQQAVEALRELDGLDGYAGAGRDYVFKEQWPGKIVATGPAAAADRTDERYWVQKLYFQGTATANDQLVTADDKGSDPTVGATDTIVTAHNLPEIPGHGHALATDGSIIVWVTAYFDYGDPQFKRYVFTQVGTGSHVALVKLTSTTGTGGLYGGVAYDVGSNGDDGAGDYTPPEGQTAGESVLIENQDEQGQPTHWAILGSYAVGVLQPGMSTEMVPRPVYTIPRGQYAQGLPLEYGDAEMDAPAATLTDFEGQDASYWDKRDETAPFSGAFSFVILTSIINNYSVDGKVYIKYRPASVDADGRLAYLGQAQNASFGVTS